MSTKLNYRILLPIAFLMLLVALIIVSGKNDSNKAVNPELGQANPTGFDPTVKDVPNTDFLVVSAGAYHFDNFDERNAFTPGIGWEYSPSKKLGWHAGTLSDSFGYQALYAGVNYATKPMFYGKVRFLLGATALHKQYKEDEDPETKLVPLPAMEVKLTDRSVLNISGSPQIDYGKHRNNAVLFFQFKVNVD